MKFLDRWLRPRVDLQKNILLTGVPRSGTTLTCRLLNQLPNVVALHEPMEVRHFASDPDDKHKLQRIHTFLHQNRRLIEKKGCAMSVHRDGVVPENPVIEAKDNSGRRELCISRGQIKIPGPFSAASLLVIKHPSVFTGMLPLLVSEFQIFATIRNPLSVLGSWMSVPFGVSDGHVPAAEGVDAKLKADLAGISEVLPRQIHLLSWFFEQYATYLPESHIIRYEDVIQSNGRALSALTDAAINIETTLESRNRNKLYDAEAMKVAGEALLQSDGGYWKFYDREDVRLLLQSL